jgi:hypothetical protein
MRQGVEDMTWLSKVCRELWGLFIEDGRFAVAIIIWVAVSAFVLPKVLPVPWRGPALLVGLLVILFENVRRTPKPRSE